MISTYSLSNVNSLRVNSPFLYQGVAQEKLESLASNEDQKLTPRQRLEAAKIALSSYNWCA